MASCPVEFGPECSRCLPVWLCAEMRTALGLSRAADPLRSAKERCNVRSTTRHRRRRGREPRDRPGLGPASRDRFEAHRSVHDVQTAERPDRDPARGSQRADRRRERLVPRRLGPREARPHRLRPPLRARAVRGLEARQGRRIRHAARGRRRQQQRIDEHGPDELLRDGAVERARPRAVPRIRSHGLPARRRHAEARGRPARRRQERAPAELRERAVRDGERPDHRAHVPEGPPVSLAGHRLHGRSHGGDARGRDGILQAVLRAGQREPRHRRRFQHRRGAQEGRALVQRREGRRARAAARRCRPPSSPGSSRKR